MSDENSWTFKTASTLLSKARGAWQLHSYTQCYSYTQWRMAAPFSYTVLQQAWIPCICAWWAARTWLMGHLYLRVVGRAYMAHMTPACARGARSRLM